MYPPDDPRGPIADALMGYRAITASNLANHQPFRPIFSGPPRPPMPQQQMPMIPASRVRPPQAPQQQSSPFQTYMMAEGMKNLGGLFKLGSDRHFNPGMMPDM